MPPLQHAVLGASSAHRWINCPASVALTKDIPDQGSTYAAEGSLAHELAELKARGYFETVRPRTYTAKVNKLKQEELWDPEMEGYTDTYLEYLKTSAMQFSAPPFVALEQKVDFSKYVPGGFGTADCIMVGGDVLRVIDFKYGKGAPVSADHNEQLMLYALGALAQYQMLYRIDTVAVAIVQPRISDAPSEWTTTPTELLQWAAEVVSPAAQQATDGTGQYAAGDWCRFCKARNRCRARADANMELQNQYPEPKNPVLLSDEELGALLKRAAPFAKWLEDLQEYALTAVLNGETVPGWKAVEGRSIRRFDDIDAALNDLVRQGVAETMLYERKPLTLAAIEKLLGKDEFTILCGPHVLRPAGKPTLVEESDKRPAYSAAAADFENIKTEKGV